MINIVSYGGGTQSTALVLMMLEGYKGLERPDFGVYADTGSEPDFINGYVDYFINIVKREYNFTIYRCQQKSGLEKHLLETPKVSRNGKFYTSSVPPFYTLSKSGKKGMLSRQCSGDFKRQPSRKFITSKIGRGVKYNLIYGISFDERSRMKVADVKKIMNKYPLVDLFVRRIDSIEYVERMGFRKPQRSSCYFCPFHSDYYWQWLKDYHPKEFKKACDFEVNIQANIRTNDMVYLHSECKPLGSIQFTDKNQLNAFPHLIDECDGDCGI